MLITGKNGSGKTSVLDALSKHLANVCQNDQYYNYEDNLRKVKSVLERKKSQKAPINEIEESERNDKYWENVVAEADSGLQVIFNIDGKRLHSFLQKEKWSSPIFVQTEAFMQKCRNMSRK